MEIWVNTIFDRNTIVKYRENAIGFKINLINLKKNSNYFMSYDRLWIYFEMKDSQSGKKNSIKANKRTFIEGIIE